MSIKQDKENTKLIPRFKDIVCSKMCRCRNICDNSEDTHVLACPLFFGYRLYGWPVRKPKDYSYNAPKLPDLRTEDLSDEMLQYWIGPEPEVKTKKKPRK